LADRDLYYESAYAMMHGNENAEFSLLIPKRNGFYCQMAHKSHTYSTMSINRSETKCKWQRR